MGRIKFKSEMERTQLFGDGAKVFLQLEFVDDANNKLLQTAQINIIQGGYQFVQNEIVEILTI